MDKAINKSTNEVVDAFEVYKNGSYQNLDKGEWFAPKDSIYNWEELQKQNITEVTVHYVRECLYKTKSGKEIARCPHFSLYPDSPAKSTEESETHKILKNWLFNHLKNNDLEILYAKGTKPHKYENKVKLSDLPINWNDFEIEVHTKGNKRLVADILIPFKKRDWLLGNGIIFEIQLSQQSDKQTHSRTIERALHGYSVCWLFYEDFNIEEDNISLKNNVVFVNSFSESMSFAKKDFVVDLKKVVEQQCRFIDEKIKELSIKQNEIEKIKDEIYKEIDHRLKSREINLINKIEQLNENPFKALVETYKEDLENKKNIIRSELLSIGAIISKKLNYPVTFGLCPKCSSGYMIKKKGKYGLFYSCSNWRSGCKHNLNIGEEDE